MRLIFAAIIGVCLSATASATETKRLTFVHDGLERTALVDMPRDALDAPVLMALHGGLAGPLTIRRKAQVSLAHDGWIVVWPSAVGDWNDGRRDWRGRPHDTADDIGFLRRLVAMLVEEGSADPDRVYVAGPSIGGMMALRLLCDAPDLVDGIAVAIASFPADFECADGPARPILFIHGTEDPLVPPAGGRIGGWNPLIRERGAVMPVEQTLETLARRNGCNGFAVTGLPDTAADDGSTVTMRAYQGCAAPLVHYVVWGGGHTWPGAAPSGLGERIVGATNRDFSATEFVEAFFRGLAGTEGSTELRVLRRARLP